MSDVQKVYVINQNRLMFSISGFEIFGSMIGIYVAYRAFTSDDPVQAISNDIIWVVEKIAPVLLKTLPKIINTFIEAFVSGLPEIIGTIGKGINTLVPSLIDSISQIVPIVFDNAGQLINSYFTQYVPKVYEFVGDVFDSIWSMITGQKSDRQKEKEFEEQLDDMNENNLGGDDFEKEVKDNQNSPYNQNKPVNNTLGFGGSLKNLSNQDIVNLKKVYYQKIRSNPKYDKTYLVLNQWGNELDPSQQNISVKAWKYFEPGLLFYGAQYGVDEYHGK